MKKIDFLLNTFLFLSIYSSISFPQEKRGTITGIVLNEATKQPIPFVNILVLDTNYGASTDENGKFKIENLPINSYSVRASAVGFMSVTKTDIIVSNIKSNELVFLLRQMPIELENVTVMSDYFSNDRTEIGSIKTFSYEEIRRSPGGFEDVIRALSVLPGVALVSSGRNDLIVRGGAPFENLFLIDGFEVSNINHFGTQGASGGPLSYVNLDFVRETSFSTGGFSSLYGDKLSSVLKIDLRNGRTDKLGGKATISASQFGFNLEGPISNNSSFFVSARRSYLDFIFKAAGFGFVPEYYDVISKFNFRLDNNINISYLFVSAFDNVKYFNDTEDQRFENSRVLGSDQIQYLTGVSFQKLFNDGFYTIFLSRNYVDYDASQRDSLLNPIFLNKSLEAENNFKTEVVLNLSNKTELTFGGSIKDIKFNTDIKLPSYFTTFGESLLIDSLKYRNRFFKSSLFSNLSWMPSVQWLINIGLRFDNFNAIEKKNYLSPRFSIAYDITSEIKLTFSSGLYNQFPSYIWLAEEFNRNLKAINVTQNIFGIEFRSSDDSKIKTEVFFKNYNNYPASLLRPYLLLANTGAGYSGTEDNFSSFGFDKLVSDGKGNSKGIEISAQKKLSDIPLYGIFSLTYSQTKFTALDGIERNGSYDQTWLINLSGGYKFDEKWETSFKFRFATGQPYTPFNSDGSQSIINYNSSRVKDLHSLDLRVDRRWFFSNFTLITYLDVQNIYNNKNGGFIRWNAREKKEENGGSIGILPSIGVSLEF